MSHRNPSANEILTHSTGDTRIPIDKSYINLARKEYYRIHGVQATLDNAQELRDIITKQWYDYYIGNPEAEKANRAKVGPIWKYGIKYRIDVHWALCRFLEHICNTQYLVKGWGAPECIRYPTTKESWVPEKCAYDLMKDMNIKFIDGYIIDNNLLPEWKLFIDTNRKTLNKYFKPQYIDYSHMAYNNSADDM